MVGLQAQLSETEAKLGALEEQRGLQTRHEQADMQMRMSLQQAASTTAASQVSPAPRTFFSLPIFLFVAMLQHMPCPMAYFGVLSSPRSRRSFIMICV